MNVNRTPIMVQRSKSKVVPCSTPEQHIDSPSGDSDSETNSPVPFLCTQDGAEGITDVVWNYYTPKAEHNGQSKIKNSTPLSRKAKKIKPKLIEKPPPQRRRILRSSHTKTELFQDLLELNQNLNELISKKSQKPLERQQSGSEDDIFSDSSDRSPKTGLRMNSRCLRKSILSSKFCKPESETLESDDSMNECLIKASQVVEDNFLNTDHTAPKRVCKDNNQRWKDNYLKIDNDSMDAILNNFKLESPIISKTKKYESLNNDSFDSLVGNLNDSALERLSQMPAKKETPVRSKDTNWTIKELIVHDGTPSKSLFGRHSSMPESPTIVDNKPSTSGTVFGRYNSMPFHQRSQNQGDSPIRCTQDEIKRKHQQAREKLLARRLLPFTTTGQSSQDSNVVTQNNIMPQRKQFQPRVPSATVCVTKKNVAAQNNSNKPDQSKPIDLKLIIEKKRQEALMKLRKRQISK